MIGLDKRSISKRAREIEFDIAKALGMKRVPLSGAAWHSKEDIESPTRIGQVKATMSKSYSIQRSDLQELVKHGRRYNKRPLFVIAFDPDGTGPLDEDDVWIAIPLSSMKRDKSGRKD